jgi:hypothetical protein
MKRIIIILLLAGVFTPQYQVAANSDTVNIELAILFTVKSHCERKLRRCFTDRNVARALISQVKNTPLNFVEAKCTDICTSPSDIRNTRSCTDEQCDDRCDVTGGLDDAFFIEVIELRRFEELQVICK